MTSTHAHSQSEIRFKLILGQFTQQGNLIFVERLVTSVFVQSVPETDDEIFLIHFVFCSIIIINQ